MTPDTPAANLEPARDTRERMLVLNPGSTSTKVAVFDGESPMFEETLRHGRDELLQFPSIMDQLDYRKNMVLELLAARGFEIASLAAVVGRGGLMRPVASGTYAVNEAMLHDVRVGFLGQHASNLGAVLAHDIAEPAGIPSFVVDPVVVDEMNDLARYSGVPEIERASLVHALNVKATARRAARELERSLDEVNLVVAHLGGGISVVAIDGGRMTDVSSALSAGPFTPERAGTVPTLELVDMCFSGDHTRDDVRRKLVGGGGFVAYLGTNSAREVEDRITKGDERAAVVMDAMIYQVAKEIGAMAAVLKGNVDAVVLTGGLANAEYITSRLASYVDFIAPVIIVPGEDEMEALAEGGLRVLRGEEAALEYPGGIGEGRNDA